MLTAPHIRSQMKKPNIGHVTLTRVSIDMLKPADYNPRIISDRARQGLSNSIDSFGLVQPIIWNKQTGNVVGGHQRLYDIIAKGATETDVIEVDWPLAKEKSANIALNHTGISGTYDDDMLADLLTEISGQDVIDFNFDELKLPEWEAISPKDAQVNIGELEDVMELKFNLSMEQHGLVMGVLNDVNESKEIALLQLLGL